MKQVRILVALIVTVEALSLAVPARADIIVNLRTLPCGDGTSGHGANRDLVNWNGDGAVDLSDAVGLLQWLFLGVAGHVLGEDCRPIAGCDGTESCTTAQVPEQCCAEVTEQL